MKREIIITSDGSHSLRVNDLGETFHSKHGAVQESFHVYIKNGIQQVNQSTIKVLEFGFGTGLNALLTIDFAEKHNKKIHYEAIEAYPLTENEYCFLNYDNYTVSQTSIQELHKLPFNITKQLNNKFSLLKHHSKIEEFSSNEKFHIIYFDVFGFDFQNELWDNEILQKAYNLLLPNGIFVTYACKGIVNKRLKSIGFSVFKVAGPPGKREMTVAVK